MNSCGGGGKGGFRSLPASASVSLEQVAGLLRILRHLRSFVCHLPSLEPEPPVPPKHLFPVFEPSVGHSCQLFPAPLHLSAAQSLTPLIVLRAPIFYSLPLLGLSPTLGYLSPLGTRSLPCCSASCMSYSTCGCWREHRPAPLSPGSEDACSLSAQVQVFCVGHSVLVVGNGASPASLQLLC